MSEEFEELPVEENQDEKTNAERSSTPEISIFFENTIGPNIKQEKLTVKTNAPIAEIKYTLSNIFSLPDDEFHLVYAGMTLDPDDILSNYDIHDGDMLLLIPVTTAGSIIR